MPNDHNIRFPFDYLYHMLREKNNPMFISPNENQLHFKIETNSEYSLIQVLDGNYAPLVFEAKNPSAYPPKTMGHSTIGHHYALPTMCHLYVMTHGIC
jgi:hypothetical protein